MQAEKGTGRRPLRGIVAERKEDDTPVDRGESLQATERRIPRPSDFDLHIDVASPWWLVQVFPPSGAAGWPSRVIPIHHDLIVGRHGGVGRLLIADGAMSRTHFKLVGQGKALRLDDLDSTNGTWVNRGRTTSRMLLEQDVVRAGDSLFVVTHEAPSMSTEFLRYGVAACCASTAATMQRLRAAAASGRRALLVAGDTGSGKALLAHAFHEMTGRMGPVVEINCMDVAWRLRMTPIEHSLREAEGGTLFLRHADMLPQCDQEKLLGYLASGQIQDGEKAPVAADVTVVVTYNHVHAALSQEPGLGGDLRNLLEENSFRLSSLGQRRLDILPIVYLTVRKMDLDPIESLGADFLEEALTTDWPHNVRQLINAVRMSQARPGQLSLLTHDENRSFPPPLTAAAEPPANATQPIAPTPELLRQLLDLHRGNVTEVASQLNTHRRQVYRWMERYGITLPKNRARFSTAVRSRH